MFELQVLGDWTNVAALAAGTLYRPTSLVGNAELANNEVAEVQYLEIVPPVTGLGVVENLENIRLILDGKEHTFINISGTDTFLTQPPTNNIFHNYTVNFGTSMVDAIKAGQGVITGTCPKYSQNLRIQAQAGVGGTSAAFRIRAWGYRYELDQLVRLLGDTIGGSFSVFDNRNNRTLDQFKIPVVPSKSTWTQLPGGLDQAVPKINFFYRYAFNVNATVPNVPYQMRYDTGNVLIEEQNMRFEYDRIKSALIVKGLGVRAPANLLQTWFNIDGDERPKSRYPTQLNNNPFHFGRAFPFLPAVEPLYYTVKTLERPYLIWNEIGYLAIQDDGAAIPANAVSTSLYGTIIEMSP